jgi:predicted RNA-binding Zn-ribbon protein involved in translation (DUF1610 family)
MKHTADCRMLPADDGQDQMACPLCGAAIAERQLAPDDVETYCGQCGWNDGW